MSNKDEGLLQQRDQLRDSSKPSLEADNSSLAHMHVEPEHSLQPDNTPDPPQPDIEMTDAPNTTGHHAAQQSMWL